MAISKKSDNPPEQKPSSRKEVALATYQTFMKEVEALDGIWRTFFNTCKNLSDACGPMVSGSIKAEDIDAVMNSAQQMDKELAAFRTNYAVINKKREDVEKVLIVNRDADGPVSDALLEFNQFAESWKAIDQEIPKAVESWERSTRGWEQELPALRRALLATQS